MRILVPLCFVLVAACATFPALDDTISDAAREAPYPQLTEIPPLPAPAQVPDSALADRVTALQERAATLRATEIGALQ